MVNNKRLVKWFNCKASAIQKIKRHGFCDEMDLASVVEYRLERSPDQHRSS